MRLRTWSVQELNRYIGRLFKADPLIQTVMVEGEISNLKRHRSGHIYFSLKDQSAKVNAVMFQWDITDESVFSEGNHIVCNAAVNLYEKEGSYNLIVRSIEQRGKGELYLAYLNLKERLEKEGLFDPSHKKKLPLLPKRVGIVTSNTGAVISDIVNVMKNRFRNGDILLYPSKVQGEGAAEELREGIRYFNREKAVDVIIIGRGGGSYEELFCFNDEDLAREIYASGIPIVSAVGHETDVSISDFVADVRASTPSMAAELVFPSREALHFHLDQLQSHILTSVERTREQRRKELELLLEKLSSSSPLMNLERERRKCEQLFKEMCLLRSNRRREEEDRLDAFAQNLASLNPLNVLKRGYSLFRKEGGILTSSQEVKEGDVLEAVMSDGSFYVEVVPDPKQRF